MSKTYKLKTQVSKKGNDILSQAKVVGGLGITTTPQADLTTKIEANLREIFANTNFNASNIFVDWNTELNKVELSVTVMEKNVIMGNKMEIKYFSLLADSIYNPSTQALVTKAWVDNQKAFFFGGKTTYTNEEGTETQFPWIKDITYNITEPSNNERVWTLTSGNWSDYNLVRISVNGDREDSINDFVCLIFRDKKINRSFTYHISTTKTNWVSINYNPATPNQLRVIVNNSSMFNTSDIVEVKGIPKLVDEEGGE